MRRQDSVGLDGVEKQRVAPQIKPLYWNDLWVPLFVIEHNTICVDLDPAVGGGLGQLIVVSDESPERLLVAESVADLCGLVVSEYDRGMLKLRDFGAGMELVEVEESLGFLWGSGADAV